MKILIVVIIVLTSMQAALCQQVISSAGTTASGSSVQLSWTVGETIIETFTGTTVIVTQGFHQGKLTITAIESEALPSITITVFPNPVNDKLKIEFSDFNTEKYFFELTDIKSRIVYKGMIVTNPQTIDMNPVTSGIYLLRIGTLRKNHWQTYKVIKQ